MTVLLDEPFALTAGTLFGTSLSTPAGHTWVEHPNVTSGQMQCVVDGEITPTSTSGVLIYPSDVTLSTTDVYVEADIDFRNSASTPTGQNIGLCARLSTSAYTCYTLRYITSVGGFRLDRIVAGATTSMATYTITRTAAVWTIGLRCEGTTLTVSINGVGQTPVTSSHITTGDRVGILAAAAGTSTTGAHLSRLTASDLSVTYSAGGTVAATTGTSGQAASVLAGSGTLAAATSTSGSATARMVAGGAAASTSTVTGSATSVLLADGAVTATTTVTGSATVAAGATTYPAAGTVVVTSGTVGQATSVLGAAGPVTMTSTVTGQATSTLLAGGTVEAVSTTEATAALIAAGTGGTVAATSDTVAEVTLLATAEGIVELVILVTGEATVRTPRPHTLAEPERRLLVLAESRVVAVPAEGRTLAVETDPRTLVVAAESRTLLIPAEDRTVLA